MQIDLSTATFGLTAEQITERERLANDLRVNASVLNTAVNAFNEMLATLGKQVSTALAAYNDSVAAGHDFITAVVDTANTLCESQSQQWHDSAASDFTNVWIEQWQSTILSDVDLEVPSRLNFEPAENAAMLLDLPEKVQSDATG